MFLLFLTLLLLYVVGGLFIIFWGARWAGKRFQSLFAYGGAFVLIFAAVFGDEVYGYAYWQQDTSVHHAWWRCLAYLK
jgi:hypothetical protein